MPLTKDRGDIIWNPLGFMDKEPIPPMEETVTTIMPEGGYRGTADPGFIDYLIGTLGAYGLPRSITPSGLAEDIASSALASAKTRRGLGEVLGGLPESYATYAYGAPAPPSPEDEILKYKSRMAAPATFGEGKPIMDLPQEPVNLQAPTPGYVHLTDARGNIIKDYTGTGASYAPSKMEPGSSAFAMFGGPSPGEERAQKYAAGQAQIEGQQAKNAQEQYLLEQAKQFGPQVLAGRPARPQMLEEIEGLASLRATRKQAVMPEAARAAQVNYEKANPGKSFSTLSQDNQQAIIDAEADRLLETGDYGRALKTWLSSKGLVGLGL